MVSNEEAKMSTPDPAPEEPGHDTPPVQEPDEGHTEPQEPEEDDEKALALMPGLKEAIDVD
jgi:hypothetical protein